MNEIEKLYQEIILVHNKSPFNFGKQDGAKQKIEAFNPVCGDQFVLYLNDNEKGIQSAGFHGYGCAISKASASVLMQFIQTKSREEVRQMIQLFLANIENEESIITSGEHKKAFDAFKAAKLFPGRKKCATLCWDALWSYLDKS